MFTIERCDETGSTNDDAAPLLGNPVAAGRVLVADRQRTGRGRRGRAWIAPAGSALLFTAILPEPVATTSLWAATLWTALCVAEGTAQATGIELELQWPNDLLLGARKCCGILCVSRVAGERAWIGCGVGLNVVRPAGDDARAQLAEIVPAPAFISDAFAEAEREPILSAILASFIARLHELEHPREIARAWERRARLAGTRYRLLVDGEPHAFEALALRLSDEGGLVVAHGGGERIVGLADARVLRE